MGLKAVELDPLSSIARSSLASSYRILGRYSEAERQVQRLLELDPGFAPAYATRADILWDTGRFAEEVEWRRKGLELDPGRTQEIMSLGSTYLELGYREAVAATRERLADVDGQSDFLGFFDVMINLRDRNDAGARETLAWLSPRLGGIADFQLFAVSVHAIAGDYAAARQTLMATAPDLLDDSSWPAFVERYKDSACVAGWVLRRSGDDALGARLLTTAAEYLDDTLPRYIEHADRYDVASCYAALGSYDRALDAIEARLADRHYAGWWLPRRAPWFEPLWGDPRFEAAMERVETELERQRAQVIRAETARAGRPASMQLADKG